MKWLLPFGSRKAICGYSLGWSLPVGPTSRAIRPKQTPKAIDHQLVDDSNSPARPSGNALAIIDQINASVHIFLGSQICSTGAWGVD